MTIGTRRTLWGLAVVLAFIIGYLLGRRKCVKEIAAGDSGNTRVVAMGAPSTGDPSHVTLGKGRVPRRAAADTATRSTAEWTAPPAAEPRAAAATPMPGVAAARV